MIHVYCGDGKGKTTAACGLALRAAGAGKRVLFAQFFKSGRSSEVDLLEKCGVTYVRPRVWHGRYKNMSEQERAEIRAAYVQTFGEIAASASGYDLIVLDEFASVLRYGIVEPDAALAFIGAEGALRELAVTGREPPARLIDIADYVTEMRKIKHPFDKGVKARKGVEY